MKSTQTTTDFGADKLAAGCLCGQCDPICKYALFRPCCGACRNEGRGADAGWAARHDATA